MAVKKKSYNFISKAKTLAYLKNKIKHAKILDLIIINVIDYKKNPKKLFIEIEKRKWLNSKLIIRSSSFNEDNKKISNAGKYLSVGNVTSKGEIKKAINNVINSYSSLNVKDEILIQPYLEHVQLSGVIFSRDPSNNTPYIKINYDINSKKTDTITSGTSNDGEIFYYHKKNKIRFKDFRDNLINLVCELEELLKNDSLDIEFAIDEAGQLILLQVRPLIINTSKPFSDTTHYNVVKRLSTKLKSWMSKHPYLYGTKGIYGVMPDWNPAEIIGRKPKPLALSLYRELVTNKIWAYQRDNYGYKNLRSFPLIKEFEGCPYVDVRVSFNSFIPKTLNSKISNKLVDYYLKKLRDNPHLHDKIEFDIIFSCITFTTNKDLQVLKNHDFNDTEIEKIKKSLQIVTNKIINSSNGLWKKDLNKISVLEKKFNEITKSDLNDISKIYWLIEDCKRYGTLPFAGLARSAFIAVEILKSLVKINILSKKDYNNFLSSLETISSKIQSDLKNLPKADFLKIYGHLRPGTYDILNDAYDENYDNYFYWKKDALKTKKFFKLNANQKNEINKHLKKNKININANDLFDFIKKTIEAREYAKFIFTKNIDSVLKIFSHICEKNNISRKDSAFTHINSITSLDNSASDYLSIIKASIERRKRRFQITKSLNLPSIILNESDVFYFFDSKSEPNYITDKSVVGNIHIYCNGSKIKKNISGKIVLIESADPGYDWIFSHNIIGLITKYGGANSHMAIRSNELGIPAAIGVGRLYDSLISTKVVEIDSTSKRILVYR